MFDTSILQDKINRIKESYTNGNFADALFASVNTGNGEMQQRIFTQNTDIEGNGFGDYIGSKRKVRLTKSSNRTTNKRLKAIAGLDLTSYQRKRAAAGRQTNPKDLEFTGGLRRSLETQIGGFSSPYVGGTIETGVGQENVAILAFNNGDAAKIAHGQEAQIANIRAGLPGTTSGDGIKIFNLNASEKDKVIEQMDELVKQILKGK